ncbi:MAG: SDR family NAD(P)-dependent oxidoreductase, partial [Spirosomaceae bacterium]|nr:SDR family NAD(P)-dependent oxidoreductase [Spirosomataceae bacterium]
MKNFEGKVVVITGAGSGIGRALAVEFNRLGAKLALNDFSETALL